MECKIIKDYYREVKILKDCVLKKDTQKCSYSHNKLENSIWETFPRYRRILAEPLEIDENAIMKMEKLTPLYDLIDWDHTSLSGKEEIDDEGVIESIIPSYELSDEFSLIYELSCESGLDIKDLLYLNNWGIDNEGHLKLYDYALLCNDNCFHREDLSL